MKKQKFYSFLRKQILLVIGFSFIPALAYLGLGLLKGAILPALILNSLVLIVSVWGWNLYRDFEFEEMSKEGLEEWYRKLTLFFYIIFALWTLAFLVYSEEIDSKLHYIAICTQIGMSIVASILLFSDRRLFYPILMILILPLIIYSLMIGELYGDVLSLFSLIFLGVLIYASDNSYNLIQKTYYQAQHDALTGLYNSRYFINYMDYMIKKTRSSEKCAYLLLIDLDHFKTINDSLGHELGDKVLQEVAQRIREYCEDTHTIARLGGDEFAIISDKFYGDGNCQERAYTFSVELLRILKETYVIDRHHLYISASVGVNSVGNSIMEARQFLKEADIAMYQAKAEGRDGIILFNEELAKEVEYRLEIERKLYFALEHHEIELSYQPQFNREQKIIGCEVLVRLNSPDLGLISPFEFVTIS
jgi:diguanylate cyclase (GGDEF)-like protein